MSVAAKIRRAPGRVTAGSFILNSGLTKLSADAQTAKTLHTMACGTYRFLTPIPAAVFVRLLALVEIALGAALLLPFVGAAFSGLALTAFSSGLLGLYLRTPGMHDGKLRPTRDGLPIAKDVWLAGIGISLLLDAALTES